MRNRTARCISIDHARRCHRSAAKRSGDLYLCRQHSTMWMLLLIEDGCAARTRRMLAFTQWERAREGQRLIDEMHRKAAA